jgi:hypothetical protein
MQRFEAERIFEREKEHVIKDLHPSDCPIAVLLGGQPASGKSRLALRVQEDYPDKDFLVVNGDSFRAYHPKYSELIKDVYSYSTNTQILSDVFTERLIDEACKYKANIIVEGTMRNPDVPMATAQKFRRSGFRVEAYIISAPALFSETGIYSRYQREVEITGSGRLADVSSHNEAVSGLLLSASGLYERNAVDRMVIYSFGAQCRITDFNFDGHSWNCDLSPAAIISQTRETQLSDTVLLSERIKTGKATLSAIDKNLKGDVSQTLNKLYTLLT